MLLPRWFRSPNWALRVALLPAIIVLGVFLSLAVWTIVMSFTGSRLLPSYHFVGTLQYVRLFSTERWWTALANLGAYTTCLLLGCLSIGYVLAALIDRLSSFGALYRTALLIPLSVSFVVTGIVWQWLLNPSLGLQHALQHMGWASFTFDWIERADRAIYTIAIAGIWQQSGMCMVLFLAGFSGIDGNIWRAARVDGISTWRVYAYVITPMLKPVFFAATVLLLTTAVKSYDLVVALTGGGPGFSSDLPARMVIDLLGRQELGMGAAGACTILIVIAAIFAPYFYSELRRQRVSP